MSWKSLVESTDKIDTELLNSFLNTSITSTIQEEYYSKADEQLEKIKEIHNEMLEKQREVYALSLMLPLNDVHKQYIVFNLLSNSGKIGKEQKHYENKVIFTALKMMPTHRAYKIFTIMQKNKVNNTRARWLAKQFVLRRKNLEFEAVKYKKWLKNIIIHNHIKPTKEVEKIFEFVFNKMKKNKKYPDIFNYYKKAKTDIDAVYKLPYSVALGFLTLHKIKPEEFYKKIESKLTHSEKIRVQNVAKRADVKIKTDLTSYSPVKLLKYLRASEAKQTNVFDIFDKSCIRVAQSIPLSFESICIVLDTSASMYGSSKKKYHPISVAEACAGVLANLAGNGEDIKSILKENLLKEPSGDTDLATPILEALEKQPELLVILSDGYENKPSGLAKQVIDAYMLKLHGKTGIIHINPVFAPESRDIRNISDKIVTMGIRDVKQLLLILLIALTELKRTKEIQKILKKLKKKVEA